MGDFSTNIWEELEPELTEMFFSGKEEYIGEMGEVIYGFPLFHFCTNTLNVVFSSGEPMLSEYGIGLSVSMLPDHYAKHAKLIPPRGDEYLHPFITTKRSITLPLYLFGVSIKKQPYEKFLTFYKILLNDESFLRTKEFLNNKFYWELLHGINHQHEWRFKENKQRLGSEYKYLIYDFGETDLNELQEQIAQEFEMIGEIIASRKNK